jgi:hypothetical protein
MKDLNIKKEINQIRKISLTKGEKSKMLHNLSLYADLHMPIESPFSILSFLKTPLSREISFALASVIITILIGGSVAYASEKSLPGDLLYPVKTKIVEPMKIALASTPGAKARVETELADNRLQEAEALDRAGKLTPELKKDLGDKFNSNVSKFNEIKKDIEKDNSTSSHEKAGKIQEEFDSKIDEHANILNKFKDDFKDTEKRDGKESEKNEDKQNKIPNLKGLGGVEKIESEDREDE